MKGIILAGGSGTRLRPMTKITSKQLLPVYDRPMIFYPLGTLLRAGIREILIIVAPERAGDFLNLLGSGRDFGAKFSFEIQDEPRGIAEAFLIGENFLGGEPAALILGDNIFEDDFAADVRDFRGGAKIFAKKVPDPERFGVVEFGPDGRVVGIVEKPQNPTSNLAIPGFYLYDGTAAARVKSLRPSARGELEIVDLHRSFLAENALEVREISGAWLDAGTPESLFLASEMARKWRADGKIDPAPGAKN